MALAYVGLVATVYVKQQALLYPGATQVSHAALAPPYWGDLISIPTPDGQTLAALYRTADPGKPTVLFFHGNGDNVAGYGFLANRLHDAGIGLLAISYRGYPGSSGEPGEAGLIADGLAGFDWLRSRIDGPIVVMGRSLGCGVAIPVAASREASALVLVSPYDSVVNLAKRRFWFLPVDFLIRDSFRSDLRIAAVTEPKLFLHGDQDQVVPLVSGQALYAVAPEPRRMTIQPGLHHSDIWNSAVLDQIVAFALAPE